MFSHFELPKKIFFTTADLLHPFVPCEHHSYYDINASQTCCQKYCYITFILKFGKFAENKNETQVGILMLSQIRPLSPFLYV